MTLALGPERAFGYLGHFAGQPSELVLVSGASFQDALDFCDEVGQPDEGSFEALHDPFVIRLRAKLVEEPGIDGVLTIVKFSPDPNGAIAWAGRDLKRLQARVAANTSTVTGDVIRSYGPLCDDCGCYHFEGQECRVFLEPSEGLAMHVGVLNDNPEEVVVVAGPPGQESALRKLAEAAGSNPEILFELPSGFVFALSLKLNGQAVSDPACACHTEVDDALEPLVRRLRRTKR